MSENNTFSWAGQVELSADCGVRINARRTAGGVCLTRTTDYDGGPMRSLELTDAALLRLVELTRPREAERVEDSPLPPDVHEALLAASGQSDSVGSTVDYGSGTDEFPCSPDLGRGLEP